MLDVDIGFCSFITYTQRAQAAIRQKILGSHHSCLANLILGGSISVIHH